MTVHREDGSADRFDCISLAQRARLPFSIFLFTLIVALITLPATTALPLGEYPRHSGRLPWADRARRWIFLASKFALVVPLVYLTSVDAAYGVPSLSSTTAQYIQLALSFFGFLFAFRWILAGSTKALSGMPAGAVQSRPRWPSFTKLPGMERHGADLRRRSWFAAYSRAPDELVQHPALALSRCLLG